MKALRIGDLTIEVPIVQGGMGVAISLSKLASAVANQGGLGVISAVALGMTEPDYNRNFKQANKRALRREIRKARELTHGKIGVNIMVAVTDFEDLLAICIEEKVDAVIMGAGLPLKLPSIIHETGFDQLHTKFISKVSSAKAARVIFQAWAKRFGHIPDAVIVEGPLAGGHLGFSKDDLAGNQKLLSEITRHTCEVLKPFEDEFNKEIPVIAGGGLYNGHDVFDIMQYGAKGAILGSRFVTTHECDASLPFKESYLGVAKDDIIIIDSPVGLPGRAIRNHFIDQITAGEKKPVKCPWKCLRTCDFKKVPYCIAEALFNSARGKMDYGFAFAGAKAYLAKRIESVAEVFESLISEFNTSENAVQLKGIVSGEVMNEKVRLLKANTKRYPIGTNVK